MSELDKLQHLGLISKVCAELDNHLGFSDKTLAEYIIHLASQHVNDPKKFHKSLHDNGAEFPESFTENLLRIIMRLTGHSVAPKAKETSVIATNVPRNEADMKYPGKYICICLFILLIFMSVVVCCSPFDSVKL